MDYSYSCITYYHTISGIMYIYIDRYTNIDIYPYIDRIII